MLASSPSRHRGRLRSSTGSGCTSGPARTNVSMFRSMTWSVRSFQTAVYLLLPSIHSLLSPPSKYYKASNGLTVFKSEHSVLSITCRSLCVVRYVSGLLSFSATTSNPSVSYTLSSSHNCRPLTRREIHRPTTQRKQQSQYFHSIPLILLRHPHSLLSSNSTLPDYKHWLQLW